MQKETKLTPQTNTKHSIFADAERHTMQHPLRIAYITGDSPDDINAWSGTIFYLRESLEKAGHIVIKAGPARPVFAHYIFAALNQLSLRIFHKRIDYRHSKLYAKAFGKIFTQRLRQETFDIALAVGGSEFIAYIKTDKPLVLVADRAIAGAVNYHSILNNLWGWSLKQSIATDKLAMERCLLNVFASDWARDAAINHYHLEPKKAVTIPFGANLNDVIGHSQIFERCDRTEILKLLFIGREWETKGGTKALECFQTITNKGIAAELHVVGCKVPEGAEGAGIIEHGFLHKNNPSELDLLTQLYLQSHFFILPTKFEAYGLVFVESAAFGLPSIAPKTGGVPTAMANGNSGILMETNSTGDDYANEIIKLWNDKNLYRQQVEKTRNTFESGFTWEVWTKKFMKKLEELQSPNNDR